MKLKNSLLWLWLILTAFNLTKAFHIDDTFHLLAAQEIAEHPLEPMTGLVNWGNDPAPMSLRNQPPLFFYMVAVVGSIFGYDVIPMHLFLSIFTFLALYFFQKISIQLRGRKSDFLMALFAFCPAFLVNQNLMTDIPIMAIALGTIYFNLMAKDESSFRNYLYAGLLLSAGVMIKYSMLPLIGVVLINMVVRRHFRFLALAFIPILILGLWSVWNYWEYGQLHILNRPQSNLNLKVILTDKIPLFAMTLGAIIPFAFIISSKIKILKFGVILSVLIPMVGFIGIPILHYIKPGLNTNDILNLFFRLAGGVFLITMAVILGKKIQLKSLPKFIKSNEFIVFAAAIALATFVGLFAPFMATRHVLLCIPFLLLFAQSEILNTKRIAKVTALALSIFLGTTLAISDWQYANFYRKTAKNIVVPKDVKVWSMGHWGWQWYSKKRGWEIYGSETSHPQIGDYVIYPSNMSIQWANENLKLEEIELISNQPNMSSYFSVSNFASMYASYLDKGPWKLAQEPFDHIYVMKVK